jgi:hypothetical protein
VRRGCEGRKDKLVRKKKEYRKRIWYSLKALQKVMSEEENGRG